MYAWSLMNITTKQRWSKSFLILGFILQLRIEEW
jgi:hypothetical protein